MKSAGHLLLAAVLVMTGAGLLSADDKPTEQDSKPGAVSYYRDIRPIFQANCQGCHQPAKPSGEYVMSSFDRLAKGGESQEPAIVVGKPDESYLIDQITPDGDEAAMPQGKKPLSEADRDLIAQWISEGAKDDTPESALPRYDMDHPPVYKLAPVISALDFSPDGKLLAASGYHEILFHNADGSGLVARLVGLSERIESIAFSPDGKSLAATGGLPGRMGEVQIWDVEARQLKLSLSVGFDTVYGASWSPNGKLLAFGCPDNTLRAIEVESGKQVLYNGAHYDWVLDTTFSVKGTHLISVSRDRSMKLVDVNTQRFIDNITSITPGALAGGLHAVDRHPSKDELLIGGADGSAKIYRMVREKVRRIGDDFNRIRAFPQQPGRLFDVAYSPDGERIVAGSSFNGTGEVRVYNTADGKLVAKLAGQEGGVYAVVFSADGKVVASGGFDGVARLNDAATGKLIKTFTPVPLEGDTVASAAGQRASKSLGKGLDRLDH